MKKLFSIATALLFVTAVVTSCKKENTVLLQTKMQPAASRADTPYLPAVAIMIDTPYLMQPTAFVVDTPYIK
jgi:3'-phosphoadenosine 5'-phosphosulfate sulfotransferase (PAPS reductase)/FAD synthetase